jgi:D-alanine-D-alanine ligase
VGDWYSCDRLHLPKAGRSQVTRFRCRTILKPAYNPRRFKDNEQDQTNSPGADGRPRCEVANALRQSTRFTVVDRVIDQPDLNELLSIVSVAQAEVIFPVLHGHWGEGGPLQELLEKIGLPYIGSKPQAARWAMDKLVTKSMLRDMVPTPPSQELHETDVCTIEPALVLKPVDDGSSVDLRICQTKAQVDQGRKELHPKRGRLMAEKYIRGRELTVGILCGQALPIIEIIPSKAVEFYDYEAKYNRDDTKYAVNPQLTPGVAEQCTRMALTAFERLGCRDVSRADIMFDGRNPWFLEINTMPGFTTHSLVPMAARSVGLEMPELCAKLVDAARARSARAASELVARA